MGRPSTKGTDSQAKKLKSSLASSATASYPSPFAASSQLSSALLANPPSHASLRDELSCLELEIKKRMEFHVLKAESKVDELKSIVNSALLYLPRDVQNMSVRDYVQKFGGNLDLFAEHEKKRAMQIHTSRLVDAATKKRTARKKISEIAIQRSAQKAKPLVEFTSGENSSFFLNASDTMVNSQLFPPSTPAMQGTDLSRRLESASVLTRKTPGGTVATKFTVALNGGIKDLTPGTMGRMDPSERKAAGIQMENMASQLQALLQQLKPNE